MKLLFVHILFMGSLFANMAGAFFVPNNANIVVGIYSGLSKNSANIDVTSLNNTHGTLSYNFDETALFVGGLVGFANEDYRFSFSYDRNKNNNFQIERTLLNFDYKVFAQENYKPIVGFGVGMSQSKIELDNKNIKKESGLLVLRAGIEYALNASNTIEVMLEYSYMQTNSFSKSFYTVNDFTTYTIKNQSSILFRIGYNFEWNIEK